MKTTDIKFLDFVWRVTALHTVTYVAAGLLFSQLFDYTSFFDSDALSVYMRPVSSPWVAAGMALNIVRGVLFGVVLWLFKDIFLFTKNGWLKLWMLFIVFAIMGTTTASPGSMEGFIYTTLSVRTHLIMLPEVLLQTLLFSVLLIFWSKRPRKAYSVIMAILLVLIVLMSLAGVFLV